MSRSPHLLALGARGITRGVVLVAHGGASKSTAPAPPWGAAALRMWPFTLDTWRAGTPHGIAVAQLDYRYRGWNRDDALEDGAWALDEIRRRHGDVPVTLIGHSMGGRLALRIAGAPNVVAVCALAPWLPAGEPAEQLRDRTLLVLHGGRDRTTDPADSYDHVLRARAAGARACRFDVRGAGHAMLERFGIWQGMARRFALATLGVGALDARVATALADPSPAACRIPL